MERHEGGELTMEGTHMGRGIYAGRQGGSRPRGSDQYRVSAMVDSWSSGGRDCMIQSSESWHRDVDVLVW